MKVLIFGATGFIGNPAAKAFARAGHIVYGTTRSEKSARALAEEEIVPVVCDPATPEGIKVFSSIAEACDVVIDTIPETSPEGPLALFNHCVSLYANRPAGAKATYIYTGGSWVHSRGEEGLESWTDERQPQSGRIKLTAWRWEVEKEILTTDKVHGIVIRPGLLYGRTGSLLEAYFGGALEAAKSGAKFDTFGGVNARFSSIHQDDLADLYLRVAERAPICKGNSFVAHNNQTERMIDVLDAIVRVSGCNGYNLRPPNPESNWEQAMGNSTTNLKPSLGEALTGWRPRKPSIVDGMDLYWASWKAARGH